MEKVLLKQPTLDSYMSHVTRKKGINGAVLCVENGDGSFSSLHCTGYWKEDDQYFIASVTKLFITAILLNLRSKNHLQLEDRMTKYLPDDLMNGIHTLNGVDYSKDITIKHLMSNTSGIPDYFTSNVFSTLLNGNDHAWPLDKTLAAVKDMKPKFKPGQKGKAQYCDTNYQLLGKIIEVVTGKNLRTVMKERIIEPLHLNNTSVFGDPIDTRVHPLYYKGNKLHVPVYLSSISAEGGIVSTAKEMMIFLKAFFNGNFFPREQIKELEKWNLIFRPGLFFYGIGISRQPLTLKGIKKGLIGHWGQSGAFAFYHHETDLFFTGTVNEVTGHGTAVKLMMKTIKTYRNQLI